MRNKLSEDARSIYDNLSSSLQEYFDWLLELDFKLGLKYLKETAK